MNLSLFQSKQRRQLREMAKQSAFGMTSCAEQAWLRDYAARDYRGAGAIVDLGCFLGATTIALAEGLSLNRRAIEKKIHAFDLFLWDEGYEAWAKGREIEGRLKPGATFLPEFLRRIDNWRNYVVVHEGDLAEAHWEGGAIELLFVDAMKSPELATAIATTFFPHLIPGESYLAHQDFPHAFTPWIHLLTWRLQDCFEFVDDLPQSSLFRLRKPIPPELFRGDLSPGGVETAQIEAAFDYSIAIVGKAKKANVTAAKAMAYLHRGDPRRAQEVIATSRHGPASMAGEFVAVQKLIRAEL